MVSKSTRAVRFQNVVGKEGSATDQTSIRAYLDRAARRLARIGEQELIKTTLTAEGDSLTATVEFPKSKHVTRTINENKKSPIIDGIEWEALDGDFMDLTVLVSPNDANIDICAIHGLGGCAFDTWQHENGTMWLRDLLPGRFPTGRIITFGYSADLVDKLNNHDRLADYADSLLSQLVLLRQATSSSSRPLILVCHSMGGLIARLAMTRLFTMQNRYSGLRPGQCGIVFLSTPHLGSRMADWSPFWDSLVDIVGVRKNLVNELKTLNMSTVDVEELWTSMNAEGQKPEIRCFCETQKTAVGFWKRKEIVFQPRAGFFGAPAMKLLGSDHHSVCKFTGSSSVPFKLVMIAIGDILQELNRRKEVAAIKVRQADEQDGLPLAGIPMLPHRSPAPLGKAFFHIGRQGAGSRGRLVGRSETTEKIISAFEDVNPESADWICLGGTGGAGKSEISFEIAGRYRNNRDVFLLKASNPDSLRQSYTSLVFELGHDILIPSYPIYGEAQAVWRGLSLEERVVELKVWLGSKQNENSIIILDDIDSMASFGSLDGLLPAGSKNVLYSSRDPELCEYPAFAASYMAISDLEIEDARALIRKHLHEIREDEIQSLLRITSCHALAMHVAINYVQKFVPLSQAASPRAYRSPITKFIDDIQNTEDAYTRENFMQRVVPGQISLKDSFQRSLDAIEMAIRGKAQRLFEVIAFVSPPLGVETSLNALAFISPRPWLRSQPPPVTFDKSDYDLFDSHTFEGNRTARLLESLHRVSLFTNKVPGGRRSTGFHPIWLECARQLCQDQAYLMGKLLEVCYMDDQNSLSQVYEGGFVDNIIAHCKGFGYKLEGLYIPDHVREWVRRQR